MRSLVVFLGIAVFVGSAMSGCSMVRLPGIYKIDIVQGNVVTTEQVNQLRLGMSQAAVRELLGTPQLTDSFHPERWDYVHSLQPGGGARQQQRLTLIFDAGGRLSEISGDLQPDPSAPPPADRQVSLDVPPQPDPERGLFDRLFDRVWSDREKNPANP